MKLIKYGFIGFCLYWFGRGFLDGMARRNNPDISNHGK